MLKLKMMLCVMMLPLVVVGCTSAVRQSRVKYRRLRRGYVPRLADTAERDYFTLKRLITMQKQLEGTCEVY